MREALLTSTITIIVGVLIFVIGQLLLRFFIEPVHELRSQIGRITHLLVYYADVYCNVGLNTEEQARTASRDIRNSGSDLLAKSSVVAWHKFWHMLRIIPKKEDLFSAHRELIGLSNGVLGGKNADVNARCIDNNTARIERIKGYLRLPPEMLR